MPKKILYSILLICLTSPVFAQVAGGQRAFEFLRLPNDPHISALGGMNVSNPDRNIAFAMQNPSLMRPGLHNTLGLNYNFYYSGVKVSNLQYGYHLPEIETSFALGVQYLNYGTFTQTDVIGNQYGDFKANDYAISLAASRKYKEKWRYGMAVKYAHSALYDKKAAALLTDVGVTYMDTANLWTVGIVAKNMGVTLNKYNPNNNPEPLPFDLQIGISKRFKYVPLRLMATIHHLHEWDIRYNNPDDVQQQNVFNANDSNAKEKSYFADKLFRHFTFGAEFLLGKRILVSASYNHMRRKELAIQDKPALSGFAFGIGLHLNKFRIQYARSHYHVAGAYNEIGLNISLNKLFGIGKAGDKIHWNATYPDWEMTTIAPTPEAVDVSEN